MENTGKSYFCILLVNFWIFALYESWEAGNSLKMLSQGVGTFSNIENFILGTLIFDIFSTLGAARQVAAFPTANPPRRDPPCARQVADPLNQSNFYSNLSPAT